MALGALRAALLRRREGKSPLPNLVLAAAGLSGALAVWLADQKVPSVIKGLMFLTFAISAVGALLARAKLKEEADPALLNVGALIVGIAGSEGSRIVAGLRWLLTVLGGAVAGLATAGLVTSHAPSTWGSPQPLWRIEAGVLVTLAVLVLATRWRQQLASGSASTRVRTAERILFLAMVATLIWFAVIALEYLRSAPSAAPP